VKKEYHLLQWREINTTKILTDLTVWILIEI